MTDAELDQARAGLAEVYKPEGVEIWLHARNKLLGGRRAIDCPAEDVLQVIEQLQAGACT